MNKTNTKYEKYITSSITSIKKTFRRNWDLYLLILPVVIYFIIFHYGPMYGVQISFKDYLPSKGIWGSPWVGLKHFRRFFNSYCFGRLIYNTISINVYSLLVGFPAPIFLALMLNEVKSLSFKRTVQMITYAPHFLSTVVLCGMIL